MHAPQRYLVTGATGPVGREVVNFLLAEGRPVAAVTRDPDRAALPAGAQVVHADPSRPQSLAAALPGVEALVVSPRAVGGGVTDLLAMAAAHGVRRVVVLSAVTVAHGGGYRRFADAFQAVEDTARASGLGWTFLRCADFATNTLAWAAQIRRTGVVRGAYGDAATSVIHERDVAAVAVSALVESGHVGRAYVLTGPESLTQRDKVRLMGEAIGAPLGWQELPPGQVRQAMLAQGVPEDVPDRMLGYLASCAATPGPTSDTVGRVLGRPALTFSTWAAEHAGTFRPDVPGESFMMRAPS